MSGNTRNTAVTDTVPEDQTVPTQFGTTLTLDGYGTGDDAADHLRLRLSTLAHNSGGRVSYGDVTFDEAGRPTCPVGFDCSAYDATDDGQINPAAVSDFEELVEGVNADRCLWTGELIPR